MNKAFYVCEHGGNPAECKDCKIKLLQDSLATQQEMTADLADELKIAETDLAEAQEALANIDLPGMDALADMGLPEYCTLQKENAALEKRIEESHACAACPERTCEWEEHEGMWRPGCCGETWEFTDGGPRENAVTHCMFCGGPMIFVTGKDGE